MIEFLKNNLSTIIISAILLFITVSVIYRRIRDRKAGKMSCGCGCSSCEAASICHPGNKAE
ncbi:MAG: FeoB-associated Cys-rich membrane protein [Clostridiaceae bacterium]|nr:FeoB-associated Cys-rich membrane protein [Clostridiaceae bacterium]